MTAWNFILQLGSIAGIFGLVGASYLYFEKRRFDKLDFERELKIVETELSRVEQDYEKQRKFLEKSTSSRIAISLDGHLSVDRRTWSEKEEDESKASDLWKKFRNDSDILDAKINYYRKMKNHSLFWFFKKDEDKSLFLSKPSKIKRFLRKIF
jgi:hypothetical protein